MKISDYIKFNTPCGVEQPGCPYFNRLRKKSRGGNISGNPDGSLTYNRAGWSNLCV